MRAGFLMIMAIEHSHEALGVQADRKLHCGLYHEREITVRSERGVMAEFKVDEDIVRCALAALGLADVESPIAD